MNTEFQNEKNLSERAYIKNQADLLRFEKGQVVYCEGSTPLGIYIVKDGRIKIKKTGIDGKEQIVRIATRGDSLSYIDLLSNTRYSNSAGAISDSNLYFLDKQKFWSLLRSHPDLFEKLLCLLSKDLKTAEEKITDLAYKPVKGRLVDALNKLGEPESANSDSLRVHISRYNLACYLGTAKETVNRMICELRDEGLIQTEENEINVLNQNKLNSICKYYD